jgi:hypothetical protein
MSFGFCTILNITIMLTVTQYPCLKRQCWFPFYVDALFPESLPIHYWILLWSVSNKMQNYLVQRQANENKNTENWKMSMDTIEKTRLTQVLANVGHNGCFTSTFLDNCYLIFVFKHSINYEINKIKKARILYAWGFY